MTFVIDQLDETDRVAIIEFNNKIYEHAKFNPMTQENRKEYKGIISNLKVRGTTDLRKAIVESMK